MKKTITKVVFLLLPAIGLRAGEGTELPQNAEINRTMIGSILITKVDFRIYKVNLGTRRSHNYYYSIDPVPDTGIGGWEITELGRLPEGTKLQIIDIKKDRWFSKPTYWVMPLSPINRNLKSPPSYKPPSQEREKLEVDLDRQIIKITNTASKRGSYIKGYYSNGAPRLNEDWFTIIYKDE